MSGEAMPGVTPSYEQRDGENGREWVRRLESVPAPP
jgi:hypothetical protein